MVTPQFIQFLIASGRSFSSASFGVEELQLCFLWWEEFQLCILCWEELQLCFLWGGALALLPLVGGASALLPSVGGASALLQGVGFSGVFPSSGRSFCGCPIRLWWNISEWAHVY